MYPLALISITSFCELTEFSLCNVHVDTQGYDINEVISRHNTIKVFGPCQRENNST